MDWGPIIAAGVGIAGDFLQQDTVNQANAQSMEQLLLTLQDNERARQAALERQQLANSATLQAANISADTARKRILGDVLLQQGQGQERLGIEAFRAAANRPERFNSAAAVLSQVLAR